MVFKENLDILGFMLRDFESYLNLLFSRLPLTREGGALTATAR